MAETTDITEPAKPWSTKEGIHKVADFLRGRAGMPVRQGIEMERRVDFFRGDRLVKFLIDSSKSPSRPQVHKKSDGIDVGTSLIKHGYIHRVVRDKTRKNLVAPHQVQSFDLDGYYAWMYEGNKTTRNFMTAVLIVGFVCVTMFPAWPVWMKVALWYVSVTLLGLIVILVVSRLLLFFVFWMVGYEVWFLPNLFDETLSVSDSFKPVISVQSGSASERTWRLAAIVFTAGLVWWIGQQPHDIDEYLSITKQFTEDLYSGKLLSDTSEEHKQNIDKPKMPSLEELLAEDANDIFAERDEDAILDAYLDQQLKEDSEIGEDDEK